VGESRVLGVVCVGPDSKKWEKVVDQTAPKRENVDLGDDSSGGCDYERRVRDPKVGESRRTECQRNGREKEVRR